MPKLPSCSSWHFRLIFSIQHFFFIYCFSTSSLFTSSTPIYSLPYVSLSLFCFSAGAVSNDYSSWRAEPQPLCPSCLHCLQWVCVCLTNWYEGSASHFLVWNEWWINDCIIQSEHGQYAEAEYLKDSKLICQYRAINKLVTAGHIRQTSWELFYLCEQPLRSSVLMYSSFLVTYHSFFSLVCLQIGESSSSWL